MYYDGEREEGDELFDTYEEARDYGEESVGAYHQGGEILEMSNPGDYPYDPDEEVDFEIVEVDGKTAYT